MFKLETYASFERSFEALLVDLRSKATAAPHLGDGQIAITLDLDTFASQLLGTVVTMGQCMRQTAADL